MDPLFFLLLFVLELLGNYLHCFCTRFPTVDLLTIVNPIVLYCYRSTVWIPIQTHTHRVVFYLTCEDKRGQVHGWKACTKPMEVVPQKFKYKQKKDNRGSKIEGVYTLVWWCEGRPCVQCMCTTCTYITYSFILDGLAAREIFVLVYKYYQLPVCV